MGRVRFLPKAVTICSREKKGFDCKNNHRCNKSANFRLDNISKINYRMLVVLSYISLGLELRKVELVWRFFKKFAPLLCS